MKVKSSRFGEMDVSKDDILHFNDGILGFEQLKKFFIVDPGDATLILWLQSITDETVAFPIIEPQIFMPEYSIALLPSDMNALELQDFKFAKVYTILTIPQDIKKISANLKAPVIINTKNNVSKQVVLQDSKLSVNFEMYKGLKKYMVSFASDDSNRSINVLKLKDELSEPVSSKSNDSAESPSVDKVGSENLKDLEAN